MKYIIKKLLCISKNRGNKNVYKYFAKIKKLALVQKSKCLIVPLVHNCPAPNSHRLLKIGQPPINNFV